MGVRRIPLRARDGSVRAYAIVDDEDYEELSRYRWSLDDAGRAKRNGKRGEEPATVRMSRQLVPNARLVDHINGNPLDNRRNNLRSASRSQNGQNRRGPNRNSSSGVRGVSRNRHDGKWWAHARVDGRLHHIGRFETRREAARAVGAFRREHMPFSADARVT